MKKRIQANPNCAFDTFEVYKNDRYQYGCEFEFYIDTNNRSFETSIAFVGKHSIWPPRALTLGQQKRQHLATVSVS